MAKLPQPPPASVLAGIVADMHILPAGTLVWRVYSQGGAHPTTWGQFRAWGPAATARFDHHVPPAGLHVREVLYGAIGADAAATALAEVFQVTRIIDRVHGSHALAAFQTIADLNLLDLRGTWPTRAGASMALASGPRPRARQWSRAIYVAYPHADGLLYPSSMNRNEPCIALYERALRAMPSHPLFNRSLSDPSFQCLLKNACSSLGYRLI